MIPPWLTTSWLAWLHDAGATATLQGFPGSIQVHGDWDTGPRRLDSWIVYRIDHGTMLLHSQGQRWRCEPGCVMLLPMGATFRGTAGSDALRFVRCRIHMPGVSGGPLISMHADGQPLGSLIEVAAQPQAVLHRERVAGALVAALAPLVEHATTAQTSQSPHSAAPPLSPAQCRRLEEWVQAHLHQRPAPSDIAQALGLSLDYCSRLFRRRYGCPPRMWLLRRRLQAVAVALLESDAPLDVIAARFGYADQTLLGRQFRQHFGLSPGRYRRHHHP